MSLRYAYVCKVCRGAFVTYDMNEGKSKICKECKNEQNN